MPPPPTFAPGDRCGAFTIVRSIGRGGYGEVFEAHDQAGTRYAVKTTKVADHHDKRALERQVLEAQALQRMSSAHIVRYVATDCENGIYWTAMEYVDGVSLREVLRRGQRLDVGWVVDVGRQLADALAHAHDAGVVHRDIKPENLLLIERPEGVLVKLIDFGIARLGGKGIGTTNIIGTPLYLAPETMRDSGTTDPRWDIYALGIMLYEALAGRHPYVRDEDEGPLEIPAVLMRAIEGQTPPLASVMPDVPAAVSECVAMAMASEPARRWQSARALKEQLDTLARINPASALTTTDRILPVLGDGTPLGTEVLPPEQLDALLGSERNAPPLTPSPTPSPVQPRSGKLRPAVRGMKAVVVPKTKKPPPAPAPQPRRGWWLAVLLVAAAAVMLSQWLR